MMNPKILFLLAVGSGIGAVSAPSWGAGTDPADPGPWLVFDVALGGGVGGFGAEMTGVRFAVQASAGGPWETLFQVAYAQQRWLPGAVNLSRYAGKQGRLRLLVEHLDERIAMDYPFWGNPRVVVGPLVGPTPPREIVNLALTPVDRMGGLLADGTIVPLDRKAQFFGYEGKELVTPGRCNLEHCLLVYAGDNYITVGGKGQPGVYVGFDMSHGFGGGYTFDPNYYTAEERQGFRNRYRGRTPFHEWVGLENGRPYEGPLPPPGFAEWDVTLPPAPARTGTTPAEAPGRPVRAEVRRPTGVFKEIAYREDVYRYQPGLKARYDPQALTLEVNMGPDAPWGWAFAGVETVGLSELPLHVQTTGDLVTAPGPHSFAGLLVDYHTPRGYQKRVFFTLGAGNAERYDLRPADWILDEAAFSLEQRLRFTTDWVDLRGPLRNRAARLALPLSPHAPADWDGRIWFAAGVQNVARNAGITVRLRDLKPYVPHPVDAQDRADLPQLKEHFAALENDELTFVISKVTGALCAGWDQATGRRLLGPGLDHYKMERRTSVSETTERLDQVEELSWVGSGTRRQLVLLCRNPALPQLTIEKRYFLEAGRTLSKRVEFATTDEEGFFITWRSGTTCDAQFLAAGRRGAGFGPRQRVAQGQVVSEDEAAPPEQVGAHEAPIVTLTDFSLGLAAYRYQVNDRFVLMGPVKNRPEGWELLGFSDYLKAGEPVSGRVRWVVFAGDFTRFTRLYQQLPEYRALHADLPRPEWLQYFVCDMMYVQHSMWPVAWACEPCYTTTTIWFLTFPWGNWGPDHFDPCRNGKHPDVWNIARSFRPAAPHLLCSAYHNFAFDKASDFYTERPWVGVRDREGNLVSTGINSDTTRSSTFYFQMANPAVKQILVDLHREKVRQWGLGFLYFDGPGGFAEEIDWGCQDVAQGYDWLDYLRQTYLAIKEVNGDAVIFTNGRAPYSQIGYSELRDQQWIDLAGPNWHNLAAALLQEKIGDPPGFVRVPTYGNLAADPALSAYNLVYGWAGNLDDARRAPWMKAAWELRFMELVEDAVQPRWYRTGEDYEAYGFRQGRMGIVSVLDHAAGPREAPVTVDTARLGLHPGQPLYVWLWQMNPTPSPDDPRPDHTWDRELAIQTVDRPAVTPRILSRGQPCPDQLELRVPTNRMLTSTVVLSHLPVILESVNDQKLQMGLIEHPDVWMDGQVTGPDVALTLVCEAESATLLLPGRTLADSTVDGPAEATDGQWAGQPALRLRLKNGRQELKVTAK